MTLDEAARILRVLVECYRRDDWTPERVQVWTTLIGDLPFEETQEAILGWARMEKWPPTPAEIRALVGEIQRGKAERARLERSELLGLPAGDQPEPAPMTTERLHAWRAVLGKPVCPPGPDSCKPCADARALLAGPKAPATRGPDPSAEVERVREWARS